MSEDIRGNRRIARLLIANRGEIACRIMRTCRRLGVATVAVHSDADAGALHVAMADRAMRIGPAPAAESYLVGGRIIEAARATGAEAIHPGYGFLSENADFAQAVIDAGLAWVGPPPEAIRAMGLKDAAKRLMEAAGVPLVPGYHGEAQDDAMLRREAERVGAPLMIKASAGGGGKGMRLVEDLTDFDAALESARREAKAAFGNADVLIERYMTSPRHIEVQILADTHGRTVALGTRDCSLQRRHQKVIEEAPAPGLTPAIEAAMCEAAVRAARAVGYANAGTVEFIADGGKLADAWAEGADGVPEGAFSFMEMNTRLQVEHPVTEEAFGVDLVEWQLRVAGGEALPEPFPPRGEGAGVVPRAAAEVRLYAEDPSAGFLPATGTLHRLRLPSAGMAAGTGELVRTDTGVVEGDAITPHYDPMIAKIITRADTRARALSLMSEALEATEVAGLVTNLPFLRRLARDPEFVSGSMDTGLIGRRGNALAADPRPEGEDWGVAALAAAGLLTRGEAHAGFRLWGRARAYVPLAFGDETRTVVLVGPDEDERFEAEAGGDRAILRVARAEAIGSAGPGVFACDAVLVLGSDGMTSRRRCSVTSHPGARVGERAVTVRFEGRAAYAFALPDPLTQGAEVGEGDAVLAPMPGTLIALDVSVGDRVAVGQRLAVLEAMKMEHALRSPRDGVVGGLGAPVGGQVAAGDAVVVLETED